MAQPASSSLTAEVESVLGPPPSSYAQAEVVVLRFRRYGGPLVVPVIVLTAIAVVAGYWVGGLPEAWMNVLLGLSAIVTAGLLGLVPVLSWMTHRTTVTTRRIILRRGVFSRTRHEVPLSRVRDVRLRQNPLQKLVGSGAIEVLHGTEALLLRSAPDAQLISDALHDLMERNYELASRTQRRAASRQAAARTATTEDDEPVSFW